jgi:hypothetical protein
MRGYLESAGFRPLTSKDALAALDLVLARDVGNLDYVDADWNRLARIGAETVPPRLRGMDRADAPDGQPLWAELAQTPEENRAAVIERMLAREIGLVLKLEASAIDAARPLAELGFDSLSSIELKNRVESRLGSAIPIGAFIGAPSIRSLTAQIAELADERMRQGVAPEAGDAGAAPAPAMEAAGQRRDRAYWAAHAAQWPGAAAFPARKHPIVSVGGPLRYGQPHGLRLRLRLTPAAAGPCTDADWVRAFGTALAQLTGRQSVLVAVQCEDGTVPVIVSTPGDGESVRRQAVLGRRHAKFDPASLPGGAGAASNGTWLAQFGFYGADAELGMPGHDLAASIALAEGNDVALTLAYDSAALDPAFVQALARDMLSGLPFRWDGQFRPVAIDRTTASAKTPRPLPPTGGADPTLPASAMQLLESIDSEAASDQFRRAWTLSQAIRITPGVDTEQLQRAVSTLTSRHESLRIRFAGERGRRRPVIGANDACQVAVHDCRQLPAADFLPVVRALADRALLPDMERLFEVHLLQFAGFDVVLVKVFEPIADGWSLALICDQLIRAYLGLDLGPAPLSLAEVQAVLARRAVHKRQKTVPEPTALPPIPWAAVGRPPQGSEAAAPGALGDSGQVSVRLSKSQTRALRRAARSLRTTENGLLAAAFARALAVSGDVDDVLLHVVHPGRPSPELETFVGFARRASIVVAQDLRRADIGAVARSLSDQFLAATDAEDAFPDLAGKRRTAAGVVSAQAFPARFGFARLLADRTLDSTLMRTLVDHQDTAIAAFSFKVEPLDLGSFGLQENQLQLRPLSRSDGTELFFFFDCDAFSRQDVEAIAGCVVRELADIDREEEPARAVPAQAGEGRRRS